MHMLSCSFLFAVVPLGPFDYDEEMTRGRARDFAATRGGSRELVPRRVPDRNSDKVKRNCINNISSVVIRHEVEVRLELLSEVYLLRHKTDAELLLC